MSRHARTLLAIGTLLALLGAASCSSDDASSDAGGATTVDVTMRDWSIEVDPAAVPAGEIAFEASNDGPTTHEFEIFSGDIPTEPLPVSDGVADTGDLVLVDEVEDVVAGTTAELTVDLDVGEYLVICNLADHYEQGMSTTLTVG